MPLLLASAGLSLLAGSARAQPELPRVTGDGGAWADPAPADPAPADAAPAAGAAPTATFEPPPPDAPTATATAAVTSAALGEPFAIIVVVEHSARIPQVNLPGNVGVGDGFEVRREASTTRARADGTVIREFELEVVGWRVGDQQLGPIEIVYTTAGTVHRVYSNPVAMRIISYVGDGAEAPRPAASPVPVRRRDWTRLYAIGGAAAAVIALGVVWLVVRRGRRRVRRASAAVQVALARAPDVEARERFDALEASGALDGDELEPAYRQMSEILRHYLGRRYGFDVIDQTTSELKAQLARRARDIERECSVWLERCDLVKFAASRATAEDAREALAAARRIVQLSSPRTPTPIPGTEEGSRRA